MRCGICGHGSTCQGTTTVTLQKDGATVVFKEVPAETCENCGERYVSEAVTSRLLKEVKGAAASGVQVEVRSFTVGFVCVLVIRKSFDKHSNLIDYGFVGMAQLLMETDSLWDESRTYVHMVIPLVE